MSLKTCCVGYFDFCIIVETRGNSLQFFHRSRSSLLVIADRFLALIDFGNKCLVVELDIVQFIYRIALVGNDATLRFSVIALTLEHRFQLFDFVILSQGFDEAQFTEFGVFRKVLNKAVVAIESNCPESF